MQGFFPIGEVNGSHGVYRPGGSALNAGQAVQWYLHLSNRVLGLQDRAILGFRISIESGDREMAEQIAADPVEREKVVLVLSQWGPGSDGENGPQLQVLFRHLLRRRLKFVLASTAEDPISVALAVTRLGIRSLPSVNPHGMAVNGATLANRVLGSEARRKADRTR